MSEGVVIYLITPLVSAFSQLLLKRAADDKRLAGLRAYLNWRVVTAYALFLGCMALNTLALRTVELSVSGVLEASGYLYVMLLSWLALGEKMTARRLAGNALIIAGIALTLLS